MQRIGEIKSEITKLSGSELIELNGFIGSVIQDQATKVHLANRTDALAKGICIYCNAAKPYKWGKTDNGNQRFRCRDCKKTFCTTTNTPVYRLRNRSMWSRYLKLMTTHIPLRALRDGHGFNLHVSTLHRWRHRFLEAITANPAAKLAGLIEADEKFFRTSYKGDRGWKRAKPPQDRKPRSRGGASQRGLGDEQVPVLTALDRSGVICQERLPNTKWASIAGKMTPWVETDSVICSDGNQVYASIAKQTGCEHMVAKKGGANTSGVSIGRIDAYHRDIENLINRRCMGVGTRYLMNYFAWSRRIRQRKPFGGDLLAEMMA